MNDQLKDIGMRLASLREDCEYTAAQMAEKLNMSEPEYIEYEKGNKDFSFSFVYNCANLLGVDVLDIISGSSPTLSKACMVEAGKGYSVKREHEYDYKHLAYTFRKKKAEPFLVTIVPEDEVPVLHGHEGQEFNYILSGEMTLYIGDISYEMKKGDSIYFDAGLPHAAKAQGDEPVQFIAVVINK